jgi:hypothetical protein
MKTERLALGLTAANLLLLTLILARLLPSTARATVSGLADAPTAAERTIVTILRGRALELFDESDRIRVRINVEDSEAVLRLLDENGTIRVKLGAGESGSGLLLLDEATEPGVHIIARRAGTAVTPTTTSVTLRGGDGRERVIVP